MELTRLACSVVIIILSLSLRSPAATAAGEKDEQGDTIGVATMNDDGTIVLRLRARTPGGGLGDGLLVYPPSHPQYYKILSHIGPIAKGQTVPVKPWPD